MEVSCGNLLLIASLLSLKQEASWWAEREDEGGELKNLSIGETTWNYLGEWESELSGGIE